MFLTGTLKISGYLSVQWRQTFSKEERKSSLKGIFMMPSGLPYRSRPFSSPSRIGEAFYVDGGLVNPVPINRIKRHENDLLAIVNVNADIPPEPKKEPEEKPADNKYLRKIRSIQDKAGQGDTRKPQGQLWPLKPEQPQHRPLC